MKNQQRNKGRGSMKSKNNSRRTGSKMREPDKNHVQPKGDMNEISSKGDGSNDPAWYATDPALLRDAASIPFSWATGTSSDMANVLIDQTSNNTKSTDNLVAPGIMSLYLMPSFGTSNSQLSPLNVAATATYGYVRYANSGSANYDAPDLMLYIAAMASIYSYINFLMRAYGCATLYSQRNRYLPDALLTSMRIDPNIKANLADFRYTINLLINQAASLAAPANMTYFIRQAFLYSNIYTEGDSIKDQIYLYNPSGFYKFGLDASGAGQLTIAQWSGTNNLSQIYNFGQQLLQPLLQSESINIMSGDILKAYGSDGILKLGALPEIYPVVPMFNIGVLEQMKNATVVSSPNLNISSLAITQSTDKSHLISQPQLSNVGVKGSDITYYESGLFDENRILTTTTSEVTPELVIENTRLMVGVSRAGSNLLLLCASEICIGAQVYTYDVQGLGILSGTPISYSNIIQRASNMTTVPTATAIMGVMMSVAPFKFCPALMYLQVNLSGTTPPVLSVGSGVFRFYNYDNYAILTGEDIQRMHEAALLNMLHVPAIGKLARE